MTKKRSETGEVSQTVARVQAGIGAGDIQMPSYGSTLSRGSVLSLFFSSLCCNR